MEQNERRNKRKLMLIVILVAVLVIGVVGVTYAFFNYTRTGGANTLGTGTISFKTDQNNDTLTLTNVFPSSSVPVGADSVAVHITGDTTYTDGVEFQIMLVNVSNTINGKTIPINYVAAYTATTSKSIGTSKSTDDAYFTDRGSTTSVYNLTSTGEVSEGKEVLKGYIAAGSGQAIDGVLTIQAYLDSSNVLISDTIAGGAIEASGYTNGTPGADTVLTTTEWNSLNGANALSFQIRAVSNEGVWIPNPNAYLANIKCQRVTDATKLHTEVCTNSAAYGYCQADGYGLNSIITYGNAKANGSALATGDAFDCDVNGDGIINKDGNGNSTERFYYVSEYYNTNSNAFDDLSNNDSYVTLIYYRNFVNGSASDNGAAYATLADIQEVDSSITSVDNWHGPVTAVKQLPTSGTNGTWSNMTLKSETRAILAEYQGTHNATSTSGGTLPTAFSYSGKAARLLTAQELMRGCGLTQVGSNQTGELSTNCKFLFEETKYANSSKATYGPWLETPFASNSNGVWDAYASDRYVVSLYASNSSGGVRPAIDVPVSLIAK